MRVLFEDCRNRATIEPSIRNSDGAQNISLKIDSGHPDDLDRAKTIVLTTSEALALAGEINSLVIDIELENHNSKPWWKRWV